MRLFEHWRTPQLRSEFLFRLDDGTPVQARPIRAEDAPRLKAGFEHMQQLSRRRRSIEDAGDIDQQLQEFTNLDQVDRAAWGCLNRERPQEPGVGVARYQRINGDRNAADVAIIVMKEYHGRGAGLLLHACLHITAHNAGIRRFYYDVSSHNERFISQLRALGAQFEGRAENIDRLSLPVYHRPRDVPDHNDRARRFGEILVKLGRAPAAD